MCGLAGKGSSHCSLATACRAVQEGADGPPAVAEAAAALAAEQAAYDAEAARMFAPPGDAREQFRRMAERGFDAAAAALLREHAALAEAERETMRILNNRCMPAYVSLAGGHMQIEVGLQSVSTCWCACSAEAALQARWAHGGDCIQAMRCMLV